MLNQTSNENKKACPFWQEDTSRCMLRNGGIHIPLTYHALFFCSTEKFTRCEHFVMSWMLSGRKDNSRQNARLRKVANHDARQEEHFSYVPFSDF